MENLESINCCSLISQNKWLEACEYLKSITKLGPNERSISTVDLNNIVRCIKSEYLSGEDERLLYLLEVFRILRNMSTTEENVQTVFSDPSILKEVKYILQKLFQDEETKLSTLLIKVILQFLVNVTVSNHGEAVNISNSLFDEILECLQKRQNEYESLALIYNLYLYNTNLELKKPFILDILKMANSKDCEYISFLVELFLYEYNFWLFYEDLGVTERIFVLELMKKLWLDRKLKQIPDISLKVLSKYFSRSTHIIFQTVSSNNEELEPYEVTLILDNLGCLCCSEEYLKILQGNKDLLIDCSVVLINIHRLGRESENYFSSVQKLSELKEPNELIRNHPAFGFKVGLVRLIANLCWKNRTVQDLAREAEVIPVLLDCCNIDARNPLIMQWVILAIRNLCENNLENQAIIAGLHKEGTVSSALVEEMGLTLHDEGSGGIRIVPLNLNK